MNYDELFEVHEDERGHEWTVRDGNIVRMTDDERDLLQGMAAMVADHEDEVFV